MVSRTLEEAFVRSCTRRTRFGLMTSTISLHLSWVFVCPCSHSIDRKPYELVPPGVWEARLEDESFNEHAASRCTHGSDRDV
jgi:hypothetical protein